jgi:hypothetical protein
VTTVGQQAILSTAAGKKFVETKVQMESLASIVAGRVLWIVDNVKDIGGKINLDGKSLRKAHIHGNYRVKASFDVLDPVLDLQRREMGLRELQVGAKSRETYWEMDARLENKSRERDRLLEQVVRDHPGVHSRLAQQTAERIGLGEEFEGAIAEEQQLGQDGRRNKSVDSGRPIPDQAEVLRQALTPDVVKPKRLDINNAP